MKPKVYIRTDHDRHWPVGVASIIVAKDQIHARSLLDEELRQRGLKGYKDEPYTLTWLDLTEPKAHVLCDGDY